MTLFYNNLSIKPLGKTEAIWWELSKLSAKVKCLRIGTMWGTRAKFEVAVWKLDPEQECVSVSLWILGISKQFTQKHSCSLHLGSTRGKPTRWNSPWESLNNSLEAKQHLGEWLMGGGGRGEKAIAMVWTRILQMTMSVCGATAWW
jgi:hypothetical protein